MKGSPRKGCRQVDDVRATDRVEASMKGSPRKGCSRVLRWSCLAFPASMKGSPRKGCRGGSWAWP